MSQGVRAWIGRDSVGLGEPGRVTGVIRPDGPLLDWLRSVTGLPARAERTGSAADARAERVRLADDARGRGLVDGDPPRLVPGFAPVLRSLAEPSLIVSAAQSSFGAVGRWQVRVGDIPVLVRDAGDGTHEYEPRPELDVVDALLARLDLLHAAGPQEREAGPPAAEGAGDAPASGAGWSGVLPSADYAALRVSDPDAADVVGARVGCPLDLVRAAAAPIAVGRVEVVRREGAGLATGPTNVAVTEVAWIDGGAHGLWTVRTAELGSDGELLAVAVRRDSPGALVGELTRAIRAEEGC